MIMIPHCLIKNPIKCTSKALTQEKLGPITFQFFNAYKHRNPDFKTLMGQNTLNSINNFTLSLNVLPY